jgi:hypothetical protein
MEVDAVLCSCQMSMPREQWPTGQHAVRYVYMPVSVITTLNPAFIHLEGSTDHWPRTNKQIGLCWSQDFIGDWVGFGPPWGSALWVMTARTSPIIQQAWAKLASVIDGRNITWSPIVMCDDSDTSRQTTVDRRLTTLASVEPAYWFYWDGISCDWLI